MKKRTKLKLFSTLIVTMFSTLVVSVASTVAWYFDLKNVDITAGAQVHGSYFQSGNGSEETPFEIHTPMQLYYFSWLQGLGYFNEVQNGTTELKQYHFYLSDDLDMTGIILPPIGTSEYPFIGTFTGKDLDGNVHSVSNLVISNESSSLTDIPLENSEFTAPEIVGFFGVVGSLDGDKQNTVNGRYNDLPTAGYTYDTSVLSISDFYIDGCTIKTQTENALIGIVAGYANGPMSGVGVVNSNIYVKAGTAPLTNFTNISDYSIIGYATESFIKTVKSDPKIETISTNTGVEKVQADDAGDAWGGSIDMNSIYNRCFNIANNSSKSSGVASATYLKQRTFHYDSEGNQIGDPVDVYDNVRSAHFGGNNYGPQSTAKFYNSNSADGSYALFKAVQQIEQGQGFCIGGMSDNEPYTEYYVTHESTQEGFKIGNSQGNYLTLNQNNNGIANTNNATNAAVWAFNQGAIYNQTTSGNYNVVYLNATNTNLTISNNKTTNWSVTDNGDGTKSISCTVNGYSHYLSYTNGEWILTRIDGYYITDGTNYLAYNNTTSVKNVTDVNQASVFYFSNTTNGYISTVNNNTLYYLYFNSNNENNPVQLSTGNAQTGTNHYRWNITDGGIYYDNDHYIIYDMEKWTCKPLSIDKNFYTISINGNYLSVNGTNVANTTNRASATKWDIDSNRKISTFINNTRYYLTYNRSGFASYNYTLTLSTTDNNNVWTISNYNGTGTIYMNLQSSWFQSNNYYLAYNNGWTMTTTSTNITTGTVNQTITYTPSKGVYQQFDTSLIFTSTNFDVLSSASITKPGGYLSYIPISAMESGDFTVKDGNTGYIISGSNETTQQYRSDIRITTYYKKRRNNTDHGITNSLTSANKIDDTKVYTCDANGNHVIDTSKCVKYESSKENYQKMLDQDNTYVYGLHFMNAEISKNRTFFAPEVLVNNTRYTNYEMPIDAIDFNLQTQGYVNFFGGSYFTNNNAFFSFHEIYRNGNEITDIKEIEEIYGTDDSTDPFCYRYKNDTHYYINKVDVGSSVPSGYSSIFKTSWITNPGISQDYKIYYYEIPVNAGEYALGSVAGGTGAYLNYLDISANKQWVDRTFATEETIETIDTYSYVDGVAFVENVGDKVDPENSATYSLGATYSSSSSDGTSYSREGDTITVSPDDNVNLEYIGNGITSTPSNPNPSIREYTTTTSITNQDLNKTQNVYIITQVQVIDLVSEKNGVKTSVTRKMIINHYRMATTGTFDEQTGGDAVRLFSYQIENFDAINNAFNYSYYLSNNVLGLTIKLKTGTDIKVTYISESPYTFNLNGSPITGSPTNENPIIVSIPSYAEPFSSILDYKDQ